MGTSRSEIAERSGMKGECDMRKKLSLMLIMNLLLCIGIIAASGVVYAATGNSQYSLSGTQYQLYTNVACTEAAVDAEGSNATLTAEADGSSNVLKMNPGTYYAKEVAAGRGYKPGTTVYTVEISASNTQEDPAVINTQEKPAFSIPEFTVFQKDTTGSSDYTGLTGTAFTVKYYDVADKEGIEKAAPKDQWTFETVKKDAPDEEAEGSHLAGFNWQCDDPVSSSRPDKDLFYTDDNGKRVLPLGWFTIEEATGPEGFKSTDKVIYGHIYLDDDGNTVTDYEGAKADGHLNTIVIMFENEPDPHITTTASIQNNNSEILNMIEYKDLIPNQKYVLRSWLADTATGEKVPGSYGSVTLTTKDSSSGQAGMVLKTEAYDEMQGNSMTTFEELYIVREDKNKSEEIQVTKNREKDDKNQELEIFQNLKVQNNVSGNLGDLSKAFNYTAEFTGLEAGMPYTVEGYDSKVFNADQSGNAMIPLKLKSGKSVTIKQLPKGAKYRITEEPSDHVAEFRVFSEDMADKGANILKNYGSNEDAAKGLSTEFEVVDLFDGTVVVRWENNRDLATITAVQSYTSIWACAMITAFAGLMMVIKKHTKSREE